LDVMERETYLLAAGTACALASAAWDLRQGRIPNPLTYGGIIAGLVLQTSLAGWRGFLDGLAASLVGGGIFFLFFLVGGMGAGDVKLMAAIGALTGLRQLVVILLASSIAGGILAFGYMVFHRRGLHTLRNVGALLRYHLTFGLQPHPEINLQSSKSIRIPYAVAIAAGTLYSLGVVVLKG
jgi:prepilin peptidase CpaA